MLENCEIAKEELFYLLEEGRKKGDWQLILEPLLALRDFAISQCEADKVQSYFDEALRIASTHQVMSIVNLLRSQAIQLTLTREFELAQNYLDQALSFSQKHHAVDREAWTRVDMAKVAFLAEDEGHVRDQLLQSIDLFAYIREPRSIAQIMRKYAHFSVSWGLFDQASVLLGAADRAYRDHGYFLGAEEKSELQMVVNELKSNMDESSWQSGWGHGNNMQIEDAIEFTRTTLLSSSD